MKGNQRRNSRLRVGFAFALQADVQEGPQHLGRKNQP
jgi:hypothetical protein